MASSWLSKVKAVLQMWWPGDEGGWATADILLGKTSPAGRLPFTWAQRSEDYPAADPAHPERSAKGINGKTTYSEGVNVGYRWFDKQNITPLFPFGFGLTYTKFQYSKLHVMHASDGGIDVHFTIKNVVTVAADEVPQAYLGSPAGLPEGVQSALRTLIAFDRIHLEADQQRDIILEVPLRRLQYWSTARNAWVTPEGTRTVYVGGSSRDLDLQEHME